MNKIAYEVLDVVEEQQGKLVVDTCDLFLAAASAGATFLETVEYCIEAGIIIVGNLDEALAAA